MVSNQNLVVCSAIVMVAAFYPLSAHAHGEEEEGPTINQHYTELRTYLQETLGEAYDTPVTGLGTADLEVGEELYVQQCASCHGDMGLGDGPAATSLEITPSDLTLGDQMNFISDAGFMEFIENGTPDDDDMPAFASTLDQEQMIQVYAYTKTLRVYSGPAEDDHLCTLSSPTGRTPGGHTWMLLAGLVGFGFYQRKRSRDHASPARGGVIHDDK